MRNGYTVLSIDDDKFIRSLVTSCLQADYNVITANNGQQGIQTAEAEQPDVILLDVEMPGMNGYEVCDKLKHNPTTKDIPVVFLSSLSNLRSRMLGYEAGGSDFLVKPFDEPEIRAKLKNLIALRSSNAVLKEQASSASDAAYTAMKGSSELGLAVHFVENIFSGTGIESIAERFFSATRQLSLRCNLMFVINGSRVYFADSGSSCPPLEVDVMSTIFDKGERFVDFGTRTQINYPHVAVLVKNMPLDDMDTYGRYKDLLPAMLGAADARLNTIEMEQAIALQTSQLSDVFDNVKDMLSKVGGELGSSQDSVLSLLRGVLNELEEKIPLMGLEEDQELYLINKLDSTIVGAQSLVEEGENSRKAFGAVISVLEKIAEKQKELAKRVSVNRRGSESPQISDADAADSVTGEVELF